MRHPTDFVFVSGDGTFESNVGMLLLALLLARDAEQETREETDRKPQARHLPRAMRVSGVRRGNEPRTVGERFGNGGSMSKKRRSCCVCQSIRVLSATEHKGRQTRE